MKDEENHLGVLMEKEPLMGASDKGGASEAPPAPLENKTGKKMVFAAALALCVFAVDALKTAAPMTHVLPSLCVVCLGQFVARARVLVHVIARAEELAEWRRAHSVDHAGLEVEEHRARHVLAALGLVVRHVDAVKLGVVVAAVLDVAADAVLVVNHLPKLCAHLVTALARLNEYKLARRSSLEAGSTRRQKARGG
jgi:hypothetical protein